MRATLLFHDKKRDELGNIMETKIWRVSVNDHTPHGFKYSLVYVVNGVRVVGYDNERGKGDHRHIAGQELPYRFTTPESLIQDFRTDMESWKQGDI
jgi:hypothetical protein